MAGRVPGKYTNSREQTANTRHDPFQQPWCRDRNLRYDFNRCWWMKIQSKLKTTVQLKASNLSWSACSGETKAWFMLLHRRPQSSKLVETNKETYKKKRSFKPMHLCFQEGCWEILKLGLQPCCFTAEFSKKTNNKWEFQYLCHIKKNVLIKKRKKTFQEKVHKEPGADAAEKQKSAPRGAKSCDSPVEQRTRTPRRSPVDTARVCWESGKG